MLAVSKLRWDPSEPSSPRDLGNNHDTSGGGGGAPFCKDNMNAFDKLELFTLMLGTMSGAVMGPPVPPLLLNEALVLQSTLLVINFNPNDSAHIDHTMFVYPVAITLSFLYDFSLRFDFTYTHAVRLVWLRLLWSTMETLLPRVIRSRSS
jgi:hypothetical protein